MSNSVAPSAEGAEDQTEQQVAAISKMFSNFMEQIDGKLHTFQTEFHSLNSKVEALILKDTDGLSPEFAQTKSHKARVSFGGGGAAADSPDGFNFDSDSRRNSQRFSMGSASSLIQKDVGTKLERPKFVVEKSKLIDGIKTEFIQDSDFINYLDEYDHYIEQWKSVPANEGLDYANEDKVAILNMPPKYAQKAAERIHWIYSTSELRFCTVDQVQKAKFWKDITSKQLRIEIGKTAGAELSNKGILDTLKRVKWHSQYGVIDMMAFANFQHEFKKTVMRIEAGEVVKIEPIHMKDIVISALPDRSLQLELFSKFGQTGSILVADFAINLVFDDIEKYITSIQKHGLGYTVNKQNRERERQSFGGKKVHHLFSEFEELDQITLLNTVEVDVHDEEHQDRVNAMQSDSGAVICRHVGLGSDGKVKCKWLADKGCVFKHPEADMKMKGKGQSQDVQKSKATMATPHTRKVHHVVAENTSSEEEES